MKYSHCQRAVVGRREASAQRSARAAPRRVRRLDTRLSAFRFLAFFFLTVVAQGADREDTGIHRRHSLTKIGAESEEIRS